MFYSHKAFFISLHLGPLSFYNVRDEVHHGLARTFVIICPVCGKNNEIKTSEQHKSGQRVPPAFDVNTRVALGCLHAGIGQTHINNLLSTLNAPTINSVTFKLREREVGKAVEGVAKSSCQDYLVIEKQEALQNGVQVDDNNLVPISCSYDMGWQKRGKGHNSRTGQGAVMGLSSGKVLDYTRPRTRHRTTRVFRIFVTSAQLINREFLAFPSVNFSKNRLIS